MVLCWKDMSKFKEYFLSLPSFLWLLVFFLFPTLIVFAFAFKPQDFYGGIKEGWSLQSILDLANFYYFILIFRTLGLSFLTTLGCLSLALPVGYFLARTKKHISQFLLFMIIVPFWSSFLIRIFAWKSFLHPEGIFKNLLVSLNLVSQETSLLYNSGAVLLVMIYTYLPFAIFPIYVAASKFNFQLLEAALDLGASRFYAFYKIFIPCIRKGIFAAMLLVFIPAIGAYVIPDLVGGTQSEMIGNKIAQRTLIDRNLPLASALAGLLTLTVVLPICAAFCFRKKTRRME